VIHLGEAVDRAGRNEIYRLNELGALDERTVLVHAVALGNRGLALARRKRASLVWCPSSNIFILGRTLNRTALGGGIPVALGTDSGLSGRGDLLDEIRYARRVGKISPSRIYEMVTCEAAKVLRLVNGEGGVAPGGVADLLIIRDQGLSPAAALQRMHSGEMELVLVNGEIKIASQDFARRLPCRVTRSLCPIVVGSKARNPVFIAADCRRSLRRPNR
jgi:cytosine/adenosine deaminase-related metal-dependent hydrolase